MQPGTRAGAATAGDGTRIAYSVHGNGGPALVLTNGYATSSFYWDRFIEKLAPKARLVTWDLKGHGASEAARDLGACTIADCVDDMRRVMDAAGVEKATLVGFSVGCQIILEAWRHLPDRIEGIVPVLGTCGRPFDSLLHPTFGRFAAWMFRHLGKPLAGPGLRLTAKLSATRTGHRLNQRTGLVGANVSRQRMAAFCHHLATIHPETWVAMGVAAQAHDATDLLATISVPVLVVSGGADVMTPPERSAEMIRQIPGCQVLELPGATHTGLYEFPDEIAAAVETLLRGANLLS